MELAVLLIGLAMGSCMVVGAYVAKHAIKNMGKIGFKSMSPGCCASSALT